MRLHGQTLAFVTLGLGAVGVMLAATNRRRGFESLYKVDEVYPLPPRASPDASSPAAILPSDTTIPSHPVTITAVPMAPEVETMVRDITRPSSTRADIPPPPPPSGTPATFAAQAVHDLTEPHTTVVRSPRQAAQDLYSYVVQAMRDGNMAKLGTREQPTDYVANAQRDMRLLSSDGIYGPKTAARGKELLGREFPQRNPTKRTVLAAKVLNDLPPAAAQVLTLPPPEPPSLSTEVSEVSPVEAANALYALVTHPPVNWGTKAKPNTLIAKTQRDMGGLTADGIYGPKTQARGTLLTGKSFPARK